MDPNEMLADTLNAVKVIAEINELETEFDSPNKLIVRFRESSSLITFTGMAIPSDDETFYYLKLFAPTNRETAEEIFATQAHSMSPYGVDVMLDAVTGDSLGLSCCMPLENFDSNALLWHLQWLNQLAVWINEAE
jgi:hypothetical protein